MGGAGKGGGAGGVAGGTGQKRKFWETNSRKHVFKILCPDQLITSIMGKGGARKDMLQETTGCKIVFSNRDEFFPGTQYRTLCVYGEEPGVIATVLDRVIDHIIECAAHEQKISNWADGDFIGKENGEYVLRGLISGKMSGAIIGTKGSNISAIREENNARVFIEKNSFNGHFMLRVIAAPDGLRSAVARVNEFVQNETDGEEFQQWALIKTFTGEEDGGGQVKGKVVAGKGGGKALRKGVAAVGDVMPAGLQPHHGKAGGAGQEHSAAGAANGRAGTERKSVDSYGLLTDTLLDFPSGSLEQEHTLTCEMPGQKVPFLVGENDSHIESVMEATGTRVSFEDARDSEDGQQTLIIQGPLIRTYRAHALMMKRYHEAAAEEAAIGALEQQAEQLQEQITELQKQLASVHAQLASKGRGKKA